jgi:beta-lactamase regulating signal transducer with metallopeptidase domain
MSPLAFPDILGLVIRTTAVLLVALCATTLLRRSSAATRHLVWTVALAGVLVLPLLERVVPAWRIVPVPAELAPAAPVAAPALAEAPVAEQQAPVLAARESAPAQKRIDWMLWAVGIWAVGGILLFARLLYGVLRIWWVERRSSELADARWTSLTDGLARRLRLRRMVTLLRGEHASVPMTWGIVRPVVLLPAEADDWSEERRTVVLAHELAHIRRWDALTQWIAHLAVAVHWYNPLVWAAARRLRQEREQACDDAVLALGARPAEYADHLLDIVRSLGNASGPAAALAMARRSQFEGRLLAILDAAVPRTGVGRAVVLGTLAAGAACIVPLAALSPAQHAVTEPLARVSARIVTPVVRSIESAQAPTVAAPVAALRPPAPAGAPAVQPERAGSGPSAPSVPSQPSAPSPPPPPSPPPTMPAASTVSAMIGAIQQPGGADLYDDIIRMAAGMESSTERRLVLLELLSRGDLRREHVVAIIEATRTMSSDTERRLVLSEAVVHRALGGTLPPALHTVLESFSSCTDERLVLVTIMERLRPSAGSMAALFRTVSKMDSDTEKRFVLAAAADHQRIDGSVREAYMAAANSIGSETDRRLALSALLGRAAPNPPPAPAAPAPRATPSAGAVWNTSTELEEAHNGRPAYRLNVRARNVRLNRAGTEVAEVLSGGALEIEHTMHGGYPGSDPLLTGSSGVSVRRSLSMRRGPDGGVVRTYRVNGVERAFGGEGHAWLAGLLSRIRAR